MPDQEIVDKVTNCLVDALGVDEDEVTLDASLTNDLGAESIDFLDIVFRLEKAFDIKIPRGELFPDNLMNNPEYVQDGQFTEKGLEVIAEKMPHLNIDALRDNPQVSNLADLFTVGMLVDYVGAKVA